MNNTKIYSVFLVLLLTLTVNVSNIFSQNLLWKVGVHNLFDNREFGASHIRGSGTTAGTQLQPIIGLQFNSYNTIKAGANLHKVWGDNKFLSQAKPIIYYNLTIPKLDFAIGAFPRENRLTRYPRIMFSDSIKWARPVVNGFFLEYKDNKSYANFWMDWTGIVDGISYESFYLGWSGRWQKNMFYVQHFGYMFHILTYQLYPHKPYPDELEDWLDGISVWPNPYYRSVKEVLKTQTEVGFDFSKKTFFDRLETNIGLSMSLERNRDKRESHLPIGITWDTYLMYKCLELRNSFYVGNRQQRFYLEYGNYVYHGDLMYKTTSYNRTDLLIYFYKSNIVDINVDISLHLAQRMLYTQQVLTARFDLNTFYFSKKEKNRQTIVDLFR